MNINREKSDSQPATLNQMVAMMAGGASQSPVQIAMERAYKITTDLKHEIKRIGQTETEIPTERLVALVQSAIERCDKEVLIAGIREKAINHLVTIRHLLDTGGTLPD